MNTSYYKFPTVKEECLRFRTWTSIRPLFAWNLNYMPWCWEIHKYDWTEVFYWLLARIILFQNIEMCIFRRHICEGIAWNIILDISCEQNTLTSKKFSNCNYNLYVKVKNGKYQTKGFVFTHWWIPNKRTWTILSGCFYLMFFTKRRCEGDST